MNNKKVTFIEDKKDECTNVEGSNLSEVINQTNGNMFSKEKEILGFLFLVCKYISKDI